MGAGEECDHRGCGHEWHALAVDLASASFCSRASWTAINVAGFGHNASWECCGTIALFNRRSPATETCRTYSLRKIDSRVQYAISTVSTTRHRPRNASPRPPAQVQGRRPGQSPTRSPRLKQGPNRPITSRRPAPTTLGSQPRCPAPASAVGTGNGRRTGAPTTAFFILVLVTSTSLDFPTTVPWSDDLVRIAGRA